MAVEFDTTEYRFEYGHEPRGRGSWAFEIVLTPSASKTFWTPGSTTYSEAKKLAAAEVRRSGASRVKVLP